jgi:hypothetical protein
MTEPKIQFPKLKGSNLEGDNYKIPEDLKGNLKILIVAFRREQTELLES